MPGRAPHCASARCAARRDHALRIDRVNDAGAASEPPRDGAEDQRHEGQQSAGPNWPGAAVSAVSVARRCAGRRPDGTGPPSMRPAAELAVKWSKGDRFREFFSVIASREERSPVRKLQLGESPRPARNSCCLCRFGLSELVCVRTSRGDQHARPSRPPSSACCLQAAAFRWQGLRHHGRRSRNGPGPCGRLGPRRLRPRDLRHHR